MSRNENVKSNVYRVEWEELKKKVKTGTGSRTEGHRDRENKAEREELKNPGREPDRDRWQKK